MVITATKPVVLSDSQDGRELEESSSSGDAVDDSGSEGDKTQEKNGQHGNLPV